MLLTLQSYLLSWFGPPICVWLSVESEASTGENVISFWSYLEDRDVYAVLIKERNICTGIAFGYIILLLLHLEIVFFLHSYFVGGTDGEGSLL